MIKQGNLPVCVRAHVRWNWVVCVDHLSGHEITPWHESSSHYFQRNKSNIRTSCYWVSPIVMKCDETSCSLPFHFQHFLFIISPQILIFYPLLNLHRADKQASASSRCFLSIMFHSGSCLSLMWQQPDVKPEQQQTCFPLTLNRKPGFMQLWHNYLFFRMNFDKCSLLIQWVYR